MTEDKSVSRWFGTNLAELLSNKIKTVYPSFDTDGYYQIIAQESDGLGYTGRVELHAKALKQFLPASYQEAIKILLAILGEENPHQTGMFTNFYWVLPIGKFIEKYGLDEYKISLNAIAEVTKRNTGEYAIRPFLRQYPQLTLEIMKQWSTSPNFHLRRLASEGTRPKLPWATKLESFIADPQPVFEILANLMADEVKFVQKSVANNLTDYLKVNKPAAVKFIRRYQTSSNPHTQWILKHATRKISIES